MIEQSLLICMTYYMSFVIDGVGELLTDKCESVVDFPCIAKYSTLGCHEQW